MTGTFWKYKPLDASHINKKIQEFDKLKLLKVAEQYPYHSVEGQAFAEPTVVGFIPDDWDGKSKASYVYPDRKINLEKGIFEYDDMKN